MFFVFFCGVFVPSCDRFGLESCRVDAIYTTLLRRPFDGSFSLCFCMGGQGRLFFALFFFFMYMCFCFFRNDEDS